MRSNPRAALSALAGLTLVVTSVLVAGSPAFASGDHSHHHHHHHPAVVGFASPAYEKQASEDIVVTLRLDRSFRHSTSVRVTSGGGNARPGVDYVAVNKRVAFAAGKRTARIIIKTSIPDIGVSPAVFTLRLGNPSKGLKISPTARTATVEIVRNDLPPLDQGATTAIETFENGVPAGYSGWATGSATAPTLSTIAAPDYYNEAENDALEVSVGSDAPAGYRLGFDGVTASQDFGAKLGFTIAFRGTGSGRSFSYRLSNGPLRFEHAVSDKYVGWGVFPVRFSDLRLSGDPTSSLRYDPSNFTGYSLDLTGLGAGNWVFDEPAVFEGD